MRLDAGRAYRARSAGGELIAFTVLDNHSEWPLVDLDSTDGPEPNVHLNIRQLLWISTEVLQTDAVSKAAAEVIDSLESTLKERGSSGATEPRMQTAEDRRCT